MATTYGLRHPDRWKLAATPSLLEAGDVVDTGYLVQVQAANGYWAPPYAVCETLEAAVAAARGRDAAVRSGRVEPFERGRGPVQRERYRIARAIRTYSDPSTCESEREQWEWPGRYVTADDPVRVSAECDF